MSDSYGNVQPKGFPPLPSDWSAEQHRLQSDVDGVTLFVSEWKKSSLPDEPSVFVLAHGMSEHSGRYLHFPHYLKGQVDVVVAMDHRGHGRSGGIRGNVKNFDEFVSDFVQVVKWTQARYPKTKRMILFGHSLGGLIVLRTIDLYKDLNVDSVSVSAPALALKAKVNPLKHIGAQILNRSWPTLKLGSEIPEEDLSHDPAVIDAHRNDELIHGKITPRLYFEMLSTMKKVLAVKMFNKSIQFIVPLADPVIDPDTTLAFVKQLESPCRLDTFSGFKHESFNEGNVPGGLNKEDAFHSLIDWIEECAEMHSGERSAGSDAK